MTTSGNPDLPDDQTSPPPGNDTGPADEPHSTPETPAESVASTDDLPNVVGGMEAETGAVLPRGDSSRRRAALSAGKRDFGRGPLIGHVLGFGSPLVVAMAFMAAFNLIDIYIVGRLEDSHEAVTIVSICDALLTLFVVFCTGIGNATVAFIARAMGKNNIASAKRTTMQSIHIISVVSAIVFVIGIFFPGTMLYLLGIGRESRVYDLGVTYLQVALGGGFTMFFVVHMTAVLRGLGDSVWPTIVLVLVNVLNITLAIFLVLGPDQGVDFGLGWGVMGAAWAALFSRIVGFVICILVFTFGVGRDYVDFNPARWRLDGKRIKGLLKIGLPSSGQLIVRVGAMLGLVAIIFNQLTTNYDTTIGTAFALCSKLELIALFMSLGWGQAASTMVGQLLGAGREFRAERAAWLATALCGGMVVLIGIGFFIYAPSVVNFFFETETSPPADIATGHPEREAAARVALVIAMAEGQKFKDEAATSGRVPIQPVEGDLEQAGQEFERHFESQFTDEYLSRALKVWHAYFTDERYKGTEAAGEAWQAYKHTEHELVVYHGTWYLRIMVFAWVFMGIGIVLSQAMTGAGDSRTPVILDFIGLVAIMLPVVFFLVGVTPLKQRTTWVTIGLAYILLAFLYAVAFRRGRWKRTHHLTAI